MASFQHQLDELQRLLADFRSQSAVVDAVAARLADGLLAGQTLFTCGNGGSAADALHLAEELVGRYRSDRRPLPALCLNADVTAITCIANDFGYEAVFARQLVALARPGDMLVAFSTSGRSPNILNALAAARTNGVLTVALLGHDGGPARDRADYPIIVPSGNSARIQELHGLVLHAICEEVEGRFGAAGA
ncbi:MAG: SIS domain-containing protein [Chloroflexi bacterium OHK40]